MDVLKREIQVAFSPKTQPIWFRVVKWSIIAFVTARYRHRNWFPHAARRVLVLALAFHSFYRWKTHGWTRAWGGWDDIPITHP